MLKTMVFIDWQNFDISYKNYITYNLGELLTIDYSKLANTLNDKLGFKSQVIKTYLFIAKPEDRLLALEKYQKQYDWLCKLKIGRYFEVIEGVQVIRTLKDVEFIIDDNRTYTTEEKGTDVNIAVQMLSKGFQNAYDIAILVSGDTDYIPVVECLHNLGKTVVLATLPQQNVDKYKSIIDNHIKIDKYIINQSVYKNKNVDKGEG